MLSINATKISNEHVTLELSISDVDIQATKNFKFTLNVKDLEELIFKLSVLDEELRGNKDSYEN